MIRKKKFYLLFTLFSLFILLFFYLIINQKNTSFDEKEINLFIPNKFSFEDLVLSLKPVLKSTKTFILVAKLKGYPTRIKHGKYKIIKGSSNNQIINVLRSKSLPIDLTFNNQETLEDLAGRISVQIESDSLDLIQSFRDSTFLEKNNFNSNNAISMYIPNSYEFYWNTTANEFRNRMLVEYKKFWNKSRTEKANQIKLSKIQISILASIIQKETNKTEEKPIIAGVYLNRLKRNMKLQADPTVVFSIKIKNRNFDTIIRRVLFKDLKINSKYNTYRFKGIPPGPICMPDISSIDAVLNPVTHNYLYFVANPEKPGYHNFSVKLSTHNFYRKKYIRWLNNKKLYR